MERHSSRLYRVAFDRVDADGEPATGDGPRRRQLVGPAECQRRDAAGAGERAGGGHQTDEETLPGRPLARRQQTRDAGQTGQNDRDDQEVFAHHSDQSRTAAQASPVIAVTRM